MSKLVLLPLLLIALSAAPPQRHQVMSDGHALTVWSKRPAGAPTRTILLLHGRTWSSLPNFDLQVPGKKVSVMDALAAKGYAVYALDQRGYGATSRDSSGWLSPDRAAKDAAAVLQWIARRDRAAGKPALLGYSRGASTAMLTAQRHPETMSALVLYAFARDLDAPIPRGTAVPATPPRARTTAEAAGSDFRTPAATTPDVVQAYVRAALARDSVRVDWRDEDQFNELDAALVRVATLIIHGEHDPLGPLAWQAKAFTRLGTGDRSWVVLPNSDHVAHVENTHRAFVSALTSFLERPR